ncbi:cadherin [Anopheles darlingi]|uniref:Cadherin n=1 Tax=Anopheles darlingi TaxID=43151 RepID=W5JE47_ANODA|nr:cadherin [Anopheles darlingi]
MVAVRSRRDYVGLILARTAFDRDRASGIRYKISSGNIGNVFAIRNATGALYVAKALDYEKIKKYELRLTASDNFKENYTTVLINVRDVNDNPPVFEKSSYRTQITEEDDRGLPKRVLRTPKMAGTLGIVSALKGHRLPALFRAPGAGLMRHSRR